MGAAGRDHGRRHRALTILGVPSAALFAALIVGIALALPALAPSGVRAARASPPRACSASTSARWSHRDALDALGSDWPIVSASRWPRCVLSVAAGALLGLHRDVSPLTGALALVAGGASGLVAIARELGGDDRVVAVVQYLRVGTGDRDRCRSWSPRLSRRQIPPGRT